MSAPRRHARAPSKPRPPLGGPSPDTSHTPPTGLASLLDDRQLVVCVGSGGVGKTTTAAALALAAALRGYQTAVLTIDPARRLRDALGIDALDNAPHRVAADRLRRAAARAGVTSETGTLEAMLLDAKRTFDELIERYAPSAVAAERVLANRIYQSVSTALAGSQDYMAMERLHALAASEQYDVLIVDTPPTQHALDFLEAPERLTALLSSRAATILQNPASILAGGSRLAQAALAAVLRGLERFTGLELLRDVADFVGGLEEFSEGFRTRAESVAAFLRSPQTAFVLVTMAETARITEALAFHRELVRAGLPFAGFVVNRVLPVELLSHVDIDLEAHQGEDLALARTLVAVERRCAALARAERGEIARLTEAAPGALVVEVALQTDEPTSLASLAAISVALGAAAPST